MFNYAINQFFYIPIASRYGSVKIEVVSSTVKGLFKGNTVETILLQFTIPIPFLKNEPFCKKAPFNLNFRVNPK